MASGNALYWRLQIAGWAAYGAANAAIPLRLAGLPLPQVLGHALILAAAGLGLSHLLRHGIQRRRLTGKPLVSVMVQTLLLSLLISVPAGVLTSLAGLAPWQAAEIGVPPQWRILAVPAVQALNWMTLLLLWSIGYYTLRSTRERAAAQLRASELARALQQSELRSLKSQLNPHFLFNALNTVRALIAEDPARAQSAVTQLARTLRYTLNAGQEECVTLERELAIVDDYLAFETLRLGERLRVERAVAPETLGQRIPVMLVQSLVENGIKHGVSELPHGGMLRISSAIDAGMFLLTIQNARPDIPLAASSSAGIGLQNSLQRLRLLFGAAASLELDLHQPGIATARVRLPCNT